MKEMEMIKERVFEVGKDPELAKALFPELDEIESYSYAYAIYIDTGKIEPVCGYLTDWLRGDEGPGFKDSFRAYLAKYRPRTLSDTVFLLDSYYLASQAFGQPIDWENYQFKKFQVVDDILAGSKAILLWHYQLEQLFGCFYRDPDKTRELRKAVNEKRVEPFDMAENLIFKTAGSLKDVIRERLVFHVTCCPNLRGAMTLFDHYVA
jgi:hypothetical protein